MSEEVIDTHNLLVEFGKHKGERWTRVPVSYLKWLINENTQWKPIAEAELERRGTTTTYTVEISGHAIDRASLRCRHIWHSTAKNKDEGIHAWLMRMVEEAIEKYGEQETITYGGLKMIIQHGEIYPTLKTVMPKK